MKTLINLIEVYVLMRIAYRVVRHYVGFIFGSKSRSRSRNKLSYGSKIGSMISTEIHSKLNGMMKNQKERLAIQDSPNVVPFKKYKRKIN